ncbi:hypothetical protein D3C87_1694330 [compost metagenome]
MILDHVPALSTPARNSAGGGVRGGDRLRAVRDIERVGGKCQLVRDGWVQKQSIIIGLKYGFLHGGPRCGCVGGMLRS